MQLRADGTFSNNFPFVRDALSTFRLFSLSRLNIIILAFARLSNPFPDYVPSLRQEHLKAHAISARYRRYFIYGF